MATDRPDSPLVEVPDPRQAMTAHEAKAYLAEHPETAVSFSAAVWVRWVELLMEARMALAGQEEYAGLIAEINRATSTRVRVGVPSITVKAG